jgi:adenylosuccinate lyase
MIERYTRPEMGAVWSDHNKFRIWLLIELAACEAQSELGQIPSDALEVIKNKANFNVDRVLEIEKDVKHDVIAFLTNVAEYVGPESRYIHLGMTSSDLLDTALAVQVKQAGAILLKDMSDLSGVLKEQALKHKETICIGRSHGIHAEPTSFGLKFVLWFDEMARQTSRLRRALENMAIGKVSGAVGNYIHIDPQVEELVCKKLGLTPANISTQVIQRDHHAEFLNALAMIGASLEKIAVEIRHLQRTEVLEAEEPFSKGQKGSSAMPHKRNPIGSENISGLARLLRSNAFAGMENIALWHERDISHSSVERVVFPDSCILADYALARMRRILNGLVVYPENMRDNLNLTHGLIFSQPVLLALTKKGMTREKAYDIVQTLAMKCWQEKFDLEQALLNDQEVNTFLDTSEIKACFDEREALQRVQYIYKKAGITE